MNIVLAILIFSLIIVIHELGHFLLAKKNGIFVKEFSIGMGPRIISLVRTEKGYRTKFFVSQHDYETSEEWKANTMYSWKVLPLGGSCMMMGEDELVEDDRAFNKKSVWARISVIFAGPLFNFILAFLLALIMIGIVGYDSAAIGSVTKNSQAEKAGILPGDVITKINGKKIDIGREVDTYFQFNPINENTVKLSYNRNGENKSINIKPELNESYLLGFHYLADGNPVAISNVQKDMPLAQKGLKDKDVITNINGTTISSGLQLSQYFEKNPLSQEAITLTYSRDGESKTVEVTPTKYQSYSIGISMSNMREKTDFLGSLKYGVVEVKYWIVTTVQSLGQLIRGKVSPNDMAGPVGIVNIIGETYESSKSDGILYVFLNMAYISILLSANLGVMNLLPIPALDGGRLVFLILEVFRGKPVDQEKEGLVHMIGLVALMILMIFIMFNDISRLF